MLLGCCHCGEDPSESIPPSQSISESESESVPPPSEESGPSYSEITSSCIEMFGCAAIPRRLTFNVTVSTGNWDGKADCLCPNYNGTFTLKFCDCLFTAGIGYRLFYATDNLGVWRGRPGFPNTDLVGCRVKASGTCMPAEGSISSSRLYYAIITASNIRVVTTTYYTAQDSFPFPTSYLARQWEFTGAINCLASASYTLTPTPVVAGFDGCGWGAGTLTPG